MSGSVWQWIPHQHIVRLAVIKFQFYRKAVKHSCTDAYIQCFHAFPCQVIISDGRRSNTRLSVIQQTGTDQCQRIIGTDTGITCCSIAHLQLQTVQPWNVLQEILFSHIPHGSQRIEVRPLVIFGKQGRPVPSCCQIDIVTISKTVADCAEIRIENLVIHRMYRHFWLCSSCHQHHSWVYHFFRSCREIFILCDNGLLSCQHGEKMLVW